MRRLRVPALAAAVLLAACGSGVPDKVKVEMRAAPGLNPDPASQAQPAAVRLYLLSSPTRLSGADYFALTDREREVLDGDLMLRREVVVRPGGTEVAEFDVPKGSTHFGVVVSFRDLDHATWMAVRKLPGNGRIPVQLGPRLVALPDKFPPAE